MAETSKIAKMASKLSDELFAEFFWTKVGPEDANWPCEDQAHHGVTTHPADVVFWYDEPYTSKRTFVHCDLKSYAKGTINTATVQGALTSLCKQVACAEKSEGWRDLYMHGNVTPDVCGLLFVYNHDGGYDKDFAAHFVNIKNDKLPLPKGSRAFVLGPKDIAWLDNVRYEIRQMRGTAGPTALPGAANCKYFYPQLDGRANLHPEKARAATLEMLTSPWIVLEYEVGASAKRGFVVFYRRLGETEEEFMYLLDYLRHYQVLEHGTTIAIKSFQAAAHATTTFQKATQRYIEGLGGGDNSELATKLRAIKYSKMTQTVSDFSEIDLGMDYE
ncbi:hypothetical protein SAMN05216428_104154 [Nitrosospira sp. Nsp11]|uniref:hypothetical protein n=1 Tax=Nitrosospira sp. Nsp11 TaxID=1855338 RepID=UPI00090F445A|nr:hypothetical protein [Nitrosospira sp. Nsp11]SHL63897.1 hypothetical protein SAMN05216428_104154 [Nitrosospira sp. Nsp11]